MFKGACRLDDPTHRSINFLTLQVKNFLPDAVTFSSKRIEIEVEFGRSGRGSPKLGRP